MKKRYLKRWIEILLISVNAIICTFILTLDSFSLDGVVILFAMMGVFYMNYLLIKRYGKVYKELLEE